MSDDESSDYGSESSYSDSSGDYDEEYSSDESYMSGDDEESSWIDDDDDDDESDDEEEDDDWSVEEDERLEMAAKEWGKFKNVQSLLRTVNDYMSIYSRLQESGELVIIGSEGIKKPRHALPSEFAGENKDAWDDLDKEEQYSIMLDKAEETLQAMEQLGGVLAEKYNVKYKQGPLKGEARIKQKRDKDYDGDIRRVIDFVRCSFIVVMESMGQAKEIVDLFRPGSDEVAEDWVLVRVKDGFEKAENFLVGGYRDIKVNIRYKPTGHIIEIQLHLKPYLELKEKGGHKHYEFARSLNVSGVTNAAQILHPKLLKFGYISDFGQTQLTQMMSRGKVGEDGNKSNGRIGQARVLRNLGDLYSEERRYGEKAVRCYDRALQLLEKKPLAGRPTKILCCEILLGMSYCVAEIQRHPDIYPAKEKYMAMDVIPLTERGMNLSKETLGANHPYSLRFARIQADYYDSTERTDIAIPIYETVLEKMTALLGKDHPESIECMGNYGDSCTSLGDSDSMLKGYHLYLDGFASALQRLGPEHPTTDNLIGNIMATAEEDGIFDEYPEEKSGLLHLLSDPRWSHHFEEDIEKVQIEDWSDPEDYSEDEEGDY